VETVKSLIKGKGMIHASPATTVFDAASMMARARIGAIVILDNGRLAGIFTERDLLNKVIVANSNPKTIAVSEVMTHNVVVANADDSCRKCLDTMKKVGCRHLPIADGDRLIGIISMRDLLMHDINEKDSEIKMMNYLYYYQPPALEE
jgi:CBS domain-containing protein